MLPHILFVRDFEERQRAVIGYHLKLRVWRDIQPAPSVKRVIDHWLGVLDEIEIHTKAMLEILTHEIGIEGT